MESQDEISRAFAKAFEQAAMMVPAAVEAGFPLETLFSNIILDRISRLGGPPEDHRAVYFIQAGENGPVKIGVAKNPAERLAQLQTVSPDVLRLLGTIQGVGRYGERTLHERFRYARVHGEWFRPTDDLMGFIAENGER